MNKVRLNIPGSKSYTNRSLILAALTKGEVRIDNPLFSDDTRSMIGCLQALGIKIKVLEDHILVSGDISDVKDQDFNLNVGLSGTTMRFILALSCITAGKKKIYGEEPLNKRPIKDLVEALRQLSGDIDYLGVSGFPPVLVKSSSLHPGTVNLRGDISSQYFSALLLISPMVGEIKFQVKGSQISKPYIDMTKNLVKKFGSKKYFIEADFSSAAYFFAVAALTKSRLTLKNLNLKSKQADIAFLKILKGMGNKIIYGKNQITIVGKGVAALNVDMKDCPDQVQTLAVLAAFAKGVTTISGVASLRIKETDRLAALQKELKKMDIKTAVTKDTLTIYGGNPKSARIETYGDHRMAMSFAIAGVKLPGMKIVNPDVVNKTFPYFWRELNKITGVQKL